MESLQAMDIRVGPLTVTVANFCPTQDLVRMQPSIVVAVGRYPGAKSCRGLSEKSRRRVVKRASIWKEPRSRLLTQLKLKPGASRISVSMSTIDGRI